MGMSWLMSEARVLASIDVADGRSERAKGLLGRDDIVGAFAIPRCRWVHTIGMRFPIDVAYVDAADVVIKIACMRRHRLALPVPKARMVIEARAGAFERWGLKVGDPLEIRYVEEHPDTTGSPRRTGEEHLQQAKPEPGDSTHGDDGTRSAHVEGTRAAHDVDSAHAAAVRPFESTKTPQRRPVS
jgi:uncharacterized membrane protein (UPF0127 family)